MRPAPLQPHTPHPTNNIDYRKWHTQALYALATLAPTLSEAALRLLIELTRRGLERPDLSFKASSRDLAAAAKCSRRHMFEALASLENSGLILTRRGTSSAPSAFRLTYLETLSMGGAPAAPPLVPHGHHPGTPAAPPLVPYGHHPGAPAAPPPIENATLFDNPPPPLDIEEESIVRIFDRVSKAKPADHDPDTLQEAREWLHGYHAKFGRTPNPHPPDHRILSQILAIAPLPSLKAVLYDLMAERREPGASYAWYLTVLLQRLYGFSPGAQTQARTTLKLIQNPQIARTPTPPAPEKTPPRESDVDAQDLVNRLAQAKTMNRR